MIAKVFEVRDRATFLPVIAVKVVPLGEEEAPRYLLRRVGYSEYAPYVLLVRASGDGACHYDPSSWVDRTMFHAHLHIAKHFDDLEDGAVVDVEFPAGRAARSEGVGTAFKCNNLTPPPPRPARLGV